MRIAIFITTVVVSIVMSAVFVNSLPTWCATPHVGSNAIVQPLCKG